MTERIRMFAGSVVLFFAALLLYAPAAEFEFVNMDDDLFVYRNPHVRAGLNATSIRWAFFADLAFQDPNIDYWQPITVISRLIDIELFGLNPAGHHAVNVVFHAINSVLLFLLLASITKDKTKSAIAALLFAVHPIHVESIAWVTARKDLLSFFFAMLSLSAYVRFMEKKNMSAYLAAFLFFAMSIMSKPMTITIPLVMAMLSLRHDGCSSENRAGSWRFSRLALRLTPFFLLSVLIVEITKGELLLGKRGLQLSFSERAGRGPMIVLRFLKSLVWPSDLACFYPMPVSLSWIEIIGPLLLVCVITAVAIRLGRRSSFISVGWFWFLIGLIPVLGSGNPVQSDRFAYFPFVGLYLFLVWSTEAIANSPAAARRFQIYLVALALPLAMATRVQMHYWSDSVTLFSRAIDVTGPNYFAERNLGLAFLERNELLYAEFHLRRSVEINPTHALSRHLHGISLLALGSSDAATEEFLEAARLDPAFRGRTPATKNE